MDGEEEFYQEEFYFNKNEESIVKNDEEYQNDHLMDTSIELLMNFQDYCKDEAIPLGEKISSIDLFYFIKYGYIL
jgi:hypothetical protein